MSIPQRSYALQTNCIAKMQSSIVIIALGLIAVSSALPVGAPPNFSIQSGFEYVGTADGKVLVMPILPKEEEYGITWREGLLRCTTAGYRMATITSQALDDVLLKYFSKVYSGKAVRWAWIDGTNFASEDRTEFFSLNTGKPLEFTNWANGRPVAAGSSYNPQCLRFSFYSDYESTWWDFGCHEKLNVICEVPVA